MAVIKGLADFSLKMLQNVGKEGEDSFFSPTSITLALTMCYAGSDANTKAEMKKVLFAGEDDAKIHETMHQLVECLTEKVEDLELTTANRLYCQKSFKILQSYQDMLEKTYKSEILSVDFATEGEKVRKQINDWVAMTTHDKIKDLVPENTLSAMTRLILVNALYFKSEWAKKFEKSNTAKLPFYMNAAKTVDVDMMSQQDRFLYSETDEYQAVVMPYVTYKVKMLILLPKAKDGLSKLEKHLDGNKLLGAIQSMQESRLNVKIPKMKLEQSFNLNDPLQALGINDAFGDNADFSQITGRKDIYISKVLHKSFVEVNEIGTEAAAATAVIMCCYSLMIDSSEPKDFIADHPFLFAILNNDDNSVLFLGHYYGSSV